MGMDFLAPTAALVPRSIPNPTHTFTPNILMTPPPSPYTRTDHCLASCQQLPIGPWHQANLEAGSSKIIPVLPPCSSFLLTKGKEGGACVPMHSQPNMLDYSHSLPPHELSLVPCPPFHCLFVYQELDDGPWHQANLEAGSSKIIPVPAPLGGAIVVGESVLTYFNTQQPTRSTQIKANTAIQVFVCVCRGGGGDWGLWLCTMCVVCVCVCGGGGRAE